MSQIIENTKYIKSDICGHYQDIKTNLQKLILIQSLSFKEMYLMYKKNFNTKIPLN
jgi:hypothetical protein